MIQSKALFISFSLSFENTGGQMLSLTHLSYVHNLHGELDVIYFKFPISQSPQIGINPICYKGYSNKFSTFINAINGKLGGITKKNEKQILTLIKTQHYSIIYFDSSFFGNIIKKVKMIAPSTPVVTFFHNIEQDFLQARIKTEGMHLIPLYLPVKINEKNAVTFSDRLIVLSQSDRNRIREIYKKDVNAVIPLSILDRFDTSKLKEIKVSKDNQLLFVGSCFFANTQGILWFTRNVLPFINYELHIVGKGWDSIAELSSNGKIKILGYIKDLSALYDNYSLVIAPIFAGAGMKVKIVEAFMFAKIVIGTKLSFEGFEDITDDFAKQCETSHEFIVLLNSLENSEKQNLTISARNYYEKHLSREYCQGIFNATMEKLYR